MTKQLIVIIFAISSLPVLASQECPNRRSPAPLNSDHVFAVKLSGSPTADARYLQLDIKLGTAVTKALRVYSEPSHTELVAVQDAEFSRTSEAARWLAFHELKNVIQTALSDAEMRITVPARPEEDNRIAVYAFGFAKQPELEQLIADGEVLSSFEFSTFINLSDLSETTHCCSGGICGQMCTECSGARFTCCLATPCCQIGCGLQYCCPDLCSC